MRRHSDPDGDVEQARSDGEGHPHGRFRPAPARILPDAERDTVIDALTGVYGTFRIVARLARRGCGVGFEVVPR